MYYMTHNITVGSYTLPLLDKVTIKKSVDTFCNTAVIVVPRTVYNKTINIESKLKMYEKVTIKLGYDGKAETTFKEFEGFLTFISVEESSITLECEDYAFLYEDVLEAKQLKNVSPKDILQHVNNEISGLSGQSLSLSCDSFPDKYESFVIRKGDTGLKVLKRVQQKTSAEMYMEDNTLHLHSQFSRKSSKAAYNFSRNIESADLTYKDEKNTKFMVIVSGTGADGKTISVKKGNRGGEVKSETVGGVITKEILQNKADEIYKSEVYTGYEGSFNAWLVPYCDAGYGVSIEDSDNEYRKGEYSLR